jgi:hypothetical protein
MSIFLRRCIGLQLAHFGLPRFVECPLCGLLQKSFGADERNFLGPLMRFVRRDLRDLITRQSPVSAPQSVVAPESPKIRLSQEFRHHPIFDFCNTIRHKRPFHTRSFGELSLGTKTPSTILETTTRAAAFVWVIRQHLFDFGSPGNRTLYCETLVPRDAIVVIVYPGSLLV